MYRLDRRGNTAPAQARGVLLARQLEMLDARAPLRPRMLRQDIDHHLHGRVADGMQRDLQPGLIRPLHHGSQLLRGPQRHLHMPVMRIRLRQPCRTGVHNPVTNHLDAHNPTVRRRLGIELPRQLQRPFHLLHRLLLAPQRLNQPIGSNAHRNPLLPPPYNKRLQRLPRALVHSHINHIRVLGPVVRRHSSLNGRHPLPHGRELPEIRPHIRDIGRLAKHAGQPAPCIPLAHAPGQARRPTLRRRAPQSPPCCTTSSAGPWSRPG
ncbi:uncharacterized protein B0T15DRAFT_16398 [Chaetomium strumarium]|uniref:Uncharacterized protein n=1 Tax=Chaetomium strumarium TaxID=1170767 RepID=A0AAJ0H116_9PEZI|nr:hypothetical protein B0T15DRAFT_16398 [Chaetomium strumarium]